MRVIERLALTAVAGRNCIRSLPAVCTQLLGCVNRSLPAVCTQLLGCRLDTRVAFLLTVLVLSSMHTAQMQTVQMLCALQLDKQFSATRQAVQCN